MPKKYLVAILWGGGGGVGKTPFKNMVVIKTASCVTKQLTPATKCFMIIVDRHSLNFVLVGGKGNQSGNFLHPPLPSPLLLG